MNTFFYSSRSSRCPGDCSYQGCAEKCAYELQKSPLLRNMTVLPQGALFPLLPGVRLRRGDLIILHAASHGELESLIENRNSLETFRLILIISDDVYDTSRRYHLLNPRYIATVKQGIEDLKKVVGRIIGQAEAPLPSQVNQKSRGRMAASR